MKKTYNVYSKMHVLKFLSVMFFFTLFFLGMSSSATAQIASSRANAGSAADADYSLTLKAEVGVTDEQALEIFMSELQEVREDSRKDLTVPQEAENSARKAFLMKAVSAMTEKNVDAKTALQMGHLALEAQVSNYQPQIRTLVDPQGIVREYVERLK